MRINLEKGHKVQEIELELKEGPQKQKLPVDFDVVAQGIRDGKIILFGMSFSSGKQGTRERTFFVWPSEKSLPEVGFANYFLYLGTIVKKGLHIFEMV
jgi:hypothetical protein